MAAGFTMLLAKIAAWAAWWGQLFVAVFVALWDFIRDAACWPFEQIMKIATGAIEALDVSALNGLVTSAGTLPAELINIMGLLHVGTCISIITAAIGIRIVLQLIPFTRLGS